ncbi:MAG: hypothetical protein AAGA48_28640 [Myxococcota bacterium]
MSRNTKALKQSFRHARQANKARCLKRYARQLVTTGHPEHRLTRAASAWLLTKGGAA